MFLNDLEIRKLRYTKLVRLPSVAQAWKEFAPQRLEFGSSVTVPYVIRHHPAGICRLTYIRLGQDPKAGMVLAKLGKYWDCLAYIMV